MFGFKFNYNHHRVSTSKPMDDRVADKLGEDYTNSSDMYVYCVECGMYMMYEESNDILGRYVCSRCGKKVKEETLLNQLERENRKFERSIKYDDIPEGCSACGGPYPDCTTSCKMFDE